MAASIFPFIGLIFGILGRKFLSLNPNNRKDLDYLNEKTINYKNYKSKTILGNRFINLALFQMLLIILSIFSSWAVIYLTKTNELPVEELFIYISVPILIIFLEIIYFYIYFKNEDDLTLILLLFIGIIITRIITGYIIRPYSIYFYYNQPFVISSITRIATSSYLIPAELITLYFVIKASFNSIKLIYN